MDEQQKQQMSKREQAREEMEQTLDKFIVNKALSQQAIDHYTNYLIHSKTYEERDTRNMEWDTNENHRAGAKEPFAINGTHDEMIVEAVLFTASNGIPCVRITDKLMQMYGQDLKHNDTTYSVKGRIHQATPFNDYVFDLERDDFKPGIYRVDKIVYVDRQSQLLTFIPYRSFARFCCTINNNIPQKMLRQQFVCAEFEKRYPNSIETYDLYKFGWD